jgi:hypothetical protein
MMKMDDYDVQTIIAVLLIAAITAATFPAALMGLVEYTGILLMTLAFFGIQAFAKLKRVTSIRELLPGILTNMEIVGITGIVSISWLFGMAVMPYDQYMAILMMILSALGITYLHSTLAAK